MVTPENLSRRERQIMNAVYSLGKATVNEVVQAIDDPPSAMSVRRTMHILVEKGYLKGQKKQKEVVYAPRKNKARVGGDAFSQVVETFFDGSLTDALAVYFSKQSQTVDPSEHRQLMELIKKWETRNDHS